MARTKSKQKSRNAASRPARAKRPRQPSANARQPSANARQVALAAFAHDIRTSLTGILALGELLASSNLGERERHWAATIAAGAEHLAALTTLVIDSAKAEAGSLTLQQRAFRPRRVLDVLRESLSARAQTKGLDAETTIAEDLPDHLIGDAVRLRAAVENLIDNAVKFTASGSVRLDARVTPAARGRVKLLIGVSDSGIGLSKAEIRRLFRPFSQASAEVARRYGGAGLGLAVVRRLARLMGGELSVTSTPGRGSSFCFTAVLPIASADAIEESGEQRALSAPARRLAVLCVEDNPYGRVILNTILTELGHRADFVGSGEEAVAAVQRGYDAVLMDLTLPDIGGLEAARRIRVLPGGTGATPIIGISGRSEAGDEAVARAAGMNAYLRKPISPSALSTALTAVAATQPAAQG
ncbi:MAG: ATP-binding protein [Xanthobacteraceae bacterium]